MSLYTPAENDKRNSGNPSSSIPTQKLKRSSSQMSTKEPHFGSFQPGQKSSFPLEDGALPGWDIPDISPSTSIWPQTEYTCSPNSTSSQALYSPYLQDSNSPFENDFKVAVPANTFSTSDLGDVSILDPTLTFHTPGDVFTFSTGTYASSPCLEPLQLQKDRPTVNIREQPLQLNLSPPALRVGEKKMPYTPAWTTAKAKTVSGKRSPKRHKQAAASNKTGMKSSRLLASGSDSDGGSTKGRKNHNLVERKYRNRLNGQFDTLLSALPPAHDDNGPRNGNCQQERRVSKSEVLIMAKEHIAALEERRATLEQQRKTLSSNIKDLKGAWVRLNGEILP